MAVYNFNPLTDPRWEAFLARHPRASIFHSTGWLRALQRTYGYEPVVLTNSAPTQDLSSAIVFCEVNSWLTGRRLVSLPFSDHCDLLVESAEVGEELMASAMREYRDRGCRYIEIRPRHVPMSYNAADFGPGTQFYFHHLKLESSIDEIHRGFHKDCVRRKIRRAEREGLAFEVGNSEELLRKTYRLLSLTRRRQQAPPQPLTWFRNLADCLGDRLQFRVALKADNPIAAIVTTYFNDSVVYKYGGSETRFNNAGGMVALFWNTIQEAKQRGMRELDLGRSDCDNPGLVTFKEHWGAERTLLTYQRHPAPEPKPASDNWAMRIAKQAFSRFPASVQATTGRLLYRHMG